MKKSSCKLLSRLKITNPGKKKRPAHIEQDVNQLK